MDIKAKIDEIVKKIKSDPKFLEQFKQEPIKTVEGLIGVDLPDDQIEKVVEGVKAKVTLDKASGLLDSVKKIFG